MECTIKQKMLDYLLHYNLISSSVTYAERLNILHVDSLELRRLKADLVMMYCSVHGLNALEFSDFFTLCNSSTRGHSVKTK